MGSTTHDQLESGQEPGRTSWLQEQRETIRTLGLPQLQFKPVAIPGEPLSVTVLRERCGDFDDPLS